MSNSINSPNRTLENQPFNQIPNDQTHEDQEWEIMARGWLSTLPEGNTVTTTDVEDWLKSNHASLPDQVKSMPRPELYECFTSIQNSIAMSNKEKEANQADHSQARFQRTDQWMPVYSWLESLDIDEVVKSKDILDWLSENPEVKEELYSKHSRYHLMHYIKKCHVKILKRKEKKKGLPITNKTNSEKVHRTGGTKLPVPLPCSNISNLPTDKDLYLAKRNEAFRKYEILVDMEKQLSSLFPKSENVNTLKES